MADQTQELKSLKEQKEERKAKYYSLDHRLNTLYREMKDLRGYRGHCIAYRQLMLAIEGMQEKIRDDYCRYEKSISRRTRRNDMAQLQKSLNRERAKREELEAKVNEATTSSGLFIKYVREKLGV